MDWKPFAIVVTGDEYFADPALLTETLCDRRRDLNRSDIIIRTRGHAKNLHDGKPGVGAEVLAERWAFLFRLPTKQIYRKGVTDDCLRLQEKKLFRWADLSLIFWDGKDTTTKALIKVAKRYCKTVEVIQYKPGQER